MIKTILTPLNNSIIIQIPNNYIGKKIEILLYALDEVTDDNETSTKKTMADFWGTLSDETANELHKNVTEIRDSWDDRLNK